MWSVTSSATINPVPQARCALRPVVVASDLGALRGPRDGLATLPQRLYWSDPGRVFNLGDPDEAAEMYEDALLSARSEADLAGSLNGELLARLWPELELKTSVRQAWEAAHPLLASAPVAVA